MRKRKIRFVVNPFSGTSKKEFLERQIKQLLDQKRYEYDFIYTQYPGHATQLTKEAVDKDYFMVVAAGGDGSINEVAEALVGKDTVLGIIPCGSGNGFSSYLGIGRNIKKAIRILNEGSPCSIDTCAVNDRFFVNVAGVGFDARIANKIRGSKVRGFWAYLKHTLAESWNYKGRNYKIEIDGETIEEQCWAVAVANASTYGYNFTIAPTAKFDDGKMEVVIIKNAPKWRYFFSAWRFLNHSLHKSSLSKHFQAKQVRILSKEEMDLHTDGEGYSIQDSLSFRINPLSLKVQCPLNFQA